MSRCRAVVLAKSRNLSIFPLVNEITQAFVLAAGLGMRLRPLTDELPKPLIPIFQKPLITFALDHLISVGVNRFVINTHRHPELFQSFFAASEDAGFPSRSFTSRICSKQAAASRTRKVISAANRS